MVSVVERLESEVGFTLSDVRALAMVISHIPYARNLEHSADTVIDEWRGTCSTKHLLLQWAIQERWPEREPELWHRLYWVTRELAKHLWGASVAAVIPTDGLGDVHTFATIEIGGGRTRVDVTAPLQDWNGVFDTPLQCGSGLDVPAGDDPLGVKRSLVLQYCDPIVREPFIAALTEHLDVHRHDRGTR